MNTIHLKMMTAFLQLLNLKSQGYEWNLIYRVKLLETECGAHAAF